MEGARAELESPVWNWWWRVTSGSNHEEASVIEWVSGIWGQDLRRETKPCFVREGERLGKGMKRMKIGAGEMSDGGAGAS